jgi:hypothetical protein
MKSLVNAIELPVIEIAKAQIAQQHNLREQINLSEVAAYACNRLPAMYVTTQESWVRQDGYVRSQMKVQIAEVVSRGIRLARREDPLRDRTPLPETVLECPAKSLARVQRILEKRDLRWKDLPNAITRASEDTNVSATTHLQSTQGYAGTNSSKLAYLQSTKKYLERSKARQAANQSGQDVKATSPEDREFGAYMVRADVSYANVLECPVNALTQQLSQQLSPGMKKLVNVDEVVAYVLNQLPSMYASCDRDFRQLNQRAKVDMGKEVVAKIREAFFKVAQAPAFMSSPILFGSFHIEQFEAIALLKQMFRRNDITWNNVYSVVQHELTFSKPLTRY